MSQKRALITGITGQDGSYLAEFLLEQVALQHEVVVVEPQAFVVLVAVVDFYVVVL